LKSGPASAIRPANQSRGGECESVYEFRSRLLIKATLDAKGDFIPAIGSEVITLRQYIQTKAKLRIYNLPGRLVEKPVANKK
jgi:hypothetical protein